MWYWGHLASCRGAPCLALVFYPSPLPTKAENPAVDSLNEKEAWWDFSGVRAGWTMNGRLATFGKWDRVLSPAERAYLYNGIMGLIHIRGLVATGPRNVGVVMERPNKSRDRLDAQGVVGHERAPQVLGVVALRPTPDRAAQFSQERFVGECAEDGVELGDDGRLSIREGCSIIRGDHREEATFLSVQGAWVLLTPASPSFPNPLEQVYYI